MIAIYARAHSEWGEALWSHLRAQMIPCALVGPERGNTALAYRLPFTVVEPECREEVKQMLPQLPVQNILTWAEDVSPESAVYAAYRERFGEDPGNTHYRGIRFFGAQLRFRGMPLHLTFNERRILNLMLWCRGQYFCAEEVALLCLKKPSPGAAAVHICNVNQKAQQLCLYKLIECRRFKGYRIP
ncbi:MAG: hypothetical protein IJD06_04785 [Clostridia bacterium]|nr:hypothetical protein [Clostridia bacterium]